VCSFSFGDCCRHVPLTSPTQVHECVYGRWYLAQQYITRPLLIGGRKFGIRLWALVPGLAPLRVYAHTRGLVLFSSHRYKLCKLGMS
jgi:hypothetical protein